MVLTFICFSPIYHFSQSSWKTAAFYSLFSFVFLAKKKWSKSKAGAQRERERDGMSIPLLSECSSITSKHQQPLMYKMVHIVRRLIHAKQSLVKKKNWQHFKIGGNQTQCIFTEMIKWESKIKISKAFIFPMWWVVPKTIKTEVRKKNTALTFVR